MHNVPFTSFFIAAIVPEKLAWIENLKSLFNLVQDLTYHTWTSFLEHCTLGDSQIEAWSGLLNWLVKVEVWLFQKTISAGWYATTLKYSFPLRIVLFQTQARHSMFTRTLLHENNGDADFLLLYCTRMISNNYLRSGSEQYWIPSWKNRIGSMQPMNIPHYTSTAVVILCWRTFECLSSFEKHCRLMCSNHGHLAKFLFAFDTSIRLTAKFLKVFTITLIKTDKLTPSIHRLCLSVLGLWGFDARFNQNLTVPFEFSWWKETNLHSFNSWLGFLYLISTAKKDFATTEFVCVAATQKIPDLTLEITLIERSHITSPTKFEERTAKTEIKNQENK